MLAQGEILSLVEKTRERPFFIFGIVCQLFCVIFKENIGCKWKIKFLIRGDKSAFHSPARRLKAKLQNRLARPLLVTAFLFLCFSSPALLLRSEVQMVLLFLLIYAVIFGVFNARNVSVYVSSEATNRQIDGLTPFTAFKTLRETLPLIESIEKGSLLRILVATLATPYAIEDHFYIESISVEIYFLRETAALYTFDLQGSGSFELVNASFKLVSCAVKQGIPQPKKETHFLARAGSNLTFEKCNFTSFFTTDIGGIFQAESRSRLLIRDSYFKSSYITDSPFVNISGDSTFDFLSCVFDTLYVQLKPLIQVIGSEIRASKLSFTGNFVLGGSYLNLSIFFALDSKVTFQDLTFTVSSVESVSSIGIFQNLRSYSLIKNVKIIEVAAIKSKAAVFLIDNTRFLTLSNIIISDSISKNHFIHIASSSGITIDGLTFVKCYAFAMISIASISLFNVSNVFCEENNFKKDFKLVLTFMTQHGPCISVVNFGLLTLSNITVRNSRSLNLVPGVSLVNNESSEVRKSSIARINQLVCERNTAVNSRDEFYFMGPADSVEKMAGCCLDLDTGGQVNIDGMSVELSKVLNSKLDKPAIGNPCIYTRDTDSNLTIVNSKFANTSADVESFCIKFIGGSLLIENSTFEFISRVDAKTDYEENRGGALHLGAGTAYLYNITVAGCQAYQGAAFYFQNDLSREKLFLVGRNLFITKNQGFQGSAMIFDHSLSEGHYIFEGVVVAENKAEYLSAILTFYTFALNISFYNCLFERNVGFYRGGVFSLLNTAGNTSFTKCHFFGNTISHYLNSHGGVIFLYSSNYAVVRSIGCVFFNNTSTGNLSYGGAISVFGGDYLDFGSIFIKNSAWTFATQIFLSADSVLGFTSSVFDGGGKTFNTSLVFLFQLGHVSITNVTFKDMTVLSGGAVRLEGQINILISGLVLFKFKSISDGILEFSENPNKNILLAEIHLIDCEARDTILIFKSVQGSLQSFLMLNTKAGRIFYTQTVSLSLFRGNFTNHECLSESDCLGRTTEGSLFSIYHLALENFRHGSIKGESLWNIKESKVLIVYSAFNAFQKSESLIMDQKNVDCIFLILIASEIKIESSNFTKINYAFIIGQESKISILLCAFFNISTFSKSSRIINIKSGTSVTVHASKFADIDGGALLVSNVRGQAIKIQSSHFYNCSAEYGGAINVLNSQVIIESCKFESCSAEAAGGSVFVKSEKLSTKNALVLSNCSFLQNKAKQGGALHCLTWLPDDLHSNFFANNTAIYGPDVGAFPIKLALTRAEQYYCGAQKSSDGLCEISNITSGIFTPSFELSVMDILGQVLSLESGLGWIEIPTQADSPSSYYVKGTSNVRISQGRIAFNGLIVVAKPKSSQVLTIKTNLLSEFYSELLPETSDQSPHFTTPDGEYAYRIKINIRACGRGEIFLKDQNICHKCPFGKFSFNPEDPACRACPENVNCEGGASFSLHKGYWRTSVNSSEIFQCSSLTGTCLGGESSQCSEGYTGFLCSVCLKSVNITYFKKNLEFCEPCSNWFIYFIVMAILAIIFLLFLSLVIYQQKMESKATYVLMKIITNHIQTISLITNIQLPFPNILKDFYVIQTYLVNASSFLYIISCLDNFRNSSVYSIGLFASIGLTGGLILFLGIFWLILGLKKRLSAKEIKAKAVNSLIILGYMFQPQFINFYIQNLTCDNYDGKSLLSFNRDQECWDTTHSLYSFVITIPFLLIWMLAFPLTFLIIFYLFRHELPSLQEKHYARYFLFGYKDQYFYWEFILIFRKYTVIMITTFWRTDQLFCLYIIIPILVCFIFLQILVKPFSTKRDNGLEIGSLLIGLTCYFSALFFSLDTPYLFQLFLIGLTMLLNFLFLVTWIYYYVKAMRFEMKQMLNAFNNIIKNIKGVRSHTYIDSTRKIITSNFNLQKESTPENKNPNEAPLNSRSDENSGGGSGHLSSKKLNRKALKFGTSVLSPRRLAFE